MELPVTGLTILTESLIISSRNLKTDFFKRQGFTSSDLKMFIM